MAGTFTPKSLGDGRLSNSQSAILTVPANTWYYVKQLSLFNTSATTQTISIYLKQSGGTARRWRRYVLEQNESAEVLEDSVVLTLEAGDAIEAMTTTNNVVDYFITGQQET
jgi:hypothetical protein